MPLHKIMQVAVQLHNFLARAQPQVESVPQQDLRAGFFHFFRRHSLYRAVSANRHKCRGLYNTAFKYQTTTTGAPISFL
ncbi:Uncharacterised protein [Yersinia enterocolitica]|nr:Uncharacterised protein [Yersinia enterocolitica]